MQSAPIYYRKRAHTQTCVLAKWRNEAAQLGNLHAQLLQHDTDACTRVLLVAQMTVAMFAACVKMSFRAST